MKDESKTNNEDSNNHQKARVKCQVKRIVGWFMCKINKHKPSDFDVVMQEATLTEPRGEPRQVTMRIGTVKCLRCGKILLLQPMGVAFDPKYDEVS